MKFLLITANVGSLFEESCRIHNVWMATFSQVVKESNAHFIAIHMQEVGGKNFEECTEQVPEFIDRFATVMQDIGYTTGRAYLDLEYEQAESYNALGSLFFIKDVTLPRVRQYDFMKKQFIKLEKIFELRDHNLLKCRMLRKAKFPKDFWPTVKWGRKGYMHCRFRIDQTVFDFVNVHLFHDESNIALIHERAIALSRTPQLTTMQSCLHHQKRGHWEMQHYSQQYCSASCIDVEIDDTTADQTVENPALYSENRKRALNFVLNELKRVTDDEKYSHPLFLFGDLNFRLDLQSFLNRITDDADLREDSMESTQTSICSTDERGSLLTVESAKDFLRLNMLEKTSDLRRTVSAIEFRRSPNDSTNDISSSCVLRIEKKRFDYFNHKRLLNEWQGYLEDDREASSFPCLHELSINFPPTYPWSENPDESESLMKTRAPAWCDRVLMNKRAFEIIKKDKSAKYDSLGKDICMGDHKNCSLEGSPKADPSREQLMNGYSNKFDDVHGCTNNNKAGDSKRGFIVHKTLF